MRFLLLVLLLSGCNQIVSKPVKETTPIVRQTACEVRAIPVPEFYPVEFTTIIVDSVAWISLTPTEHSALQTNHAKLVGYSRELLTELRQVQECINRHNRGTK